jgi:uncharacterized repeat protein (TIGR03803 family)
MNSLPLRNVVLLFTFVAFLFSALASAQWNETVLYNFPSGTDGTFPTSALVSDPLENLYGTTPSGGSSNSGTVFRLSPKTGGGWTESIIYSFSGSNGEYPDSALTCDSAGNLYGTAGSGGMFGYGVVYELSPDGDTWNETVLYSFTGETDGGDPVDGVIFDSSGNLYGTALSGGTLGAYCDQGCGTVYKLVPGLSGWSQSVLYTFGGYPNDGAFPHGPLIFDAAGNLYSTTNQGGTYDSQGTAFELSPGSSGGWNETILTMFGRTDNYGGIFPQSGMVFGPGGNLYGTAAGGDIYDGGVVYELSQFAGSWNELPIYTFPFGFKAGKDGGFPVAGLLYRGGVFYGTTTKGGDYNDGIVFKLIKEQDSDRQWKETVLYSFDHASNNGFSPAAGLISDSGGNLYGTASNGGVNGFGTAFKLDADRRYAETVMHSFSGDPGGRDPQAGLASDSAGNLYGTASGGGAHNYGTVFRLVRGSDGWTQNVLHSFKGGTDGANPEGPVVADNAGNLYGTTTYGGTTGKCEGNGCGTLYELSKSESAWKETLLHIFTGTPDGLFPYSGLTFDSDGNLYGTTYQGGAFGFGTVFELSPSAGGWIETILYSFTGGTDGSRPYGSMTFDSYGNLYGTTSLGGVADAGVVFELKPAVGGGWSESVIYTFPSGWVNGAYPHGGVVFDSVGNLYGTTYGGGDSLSYCELGCGAVFELVPTSGGVWQENIVFSFNGSTTGGNPGGNLTFDSAGNLYGLAEIAFELSPSGGSTWNETILDNFGGSGGNHSGGYYASGNLIFDNAGNLYGTTELGGSVDLGVVFELSP